MRRPCLADSLFVCEPNFNPLYEALVFAAEEHLTNLLREIQDFNPLYEALVFAARFLFYRVIPHFINFNPLYEALVFAARGLCSYPWFRKTRFQSSIRGFSFCGMRKQGIIDPNTNISILYTRL